MGQPSWNGLSEMQRSGLLALDLIRMREDRAGDMVKSRDINRSVVLATDGQDWSERLNMADDDVDVVDGDTGTGVVTKTRPKTKKPKLYKVLMLNDDYTPMDFVVYVLERFFNMGTDKATQVMLHVHMKGVGICGVYTYEVAETKLVQVMDFARQNQHPLQCVMEEE